MKHNETIVILGVLTAFTIIFGILLMPLTNLSQAFSGGAILALFYKAITDIRK